MGEKVRASNLASAGAAFLASTAARLMRPRYMPRISAGGGKVAAAGLQVRYEQAVVAGYVHTRALLDKARQDTRNGAAADAAIRRKIGDASERFTKVAKTLDPDGLAAELLTLFCAGVPHLDELDNKRRIVSVWSALLAPAVVMREKLGAEITINRLPELAKEWVAEGYTAESLKAFGFPETRFIASHPARVYELLADTAASIPGIDHMRLMSSVIDPVVLSIGHFVGAERALAGVADADLDGLVERYAASTTPP